MSKEALHDDWSNYAHRIAGVQCLRFFKSDTNTALLRELLEIPPETFESDTNFKPIRLQAFETVLGWGLPMKPPKFADELTVLDLARSNITDETLGLIGQLKNLTKLDLNGTGIAWTG